MSIFRFKQAMLAFICLIATTGNISGQTKIIEIWNGKVPGSIQNPNNKQIVDSAYWIKIRFVTNPTIQVYPAPADKNCLSHSLLVQLQKRLRYNKEERIERSVFEQHK